MGVKPTAVYYKAMISRWGVCNVRDKSICFSAYLARKAAIKRVKIGACSTTLLMRLSSIIFIVLLSNHHLYWF